MDQEKIGKFIRKLRKERGLTQAELGEKINVSCKTISKWETGLRIPDYSYLNDICDVLETNIIDLLSGEKKSETFTNKWDNKRKISKTGIFIVIGLIILYILPVIILLFIYSYI